MGMSNFVKKMMFAHQLEFEEGKFEMLGIRGTILPVFTLTRIIESLFEEKGEDAFDLLFQVGKEHGELGVEKMGREHKVSKREFFQKLTKSANVMGLGTVEMERFEMDEKKIVLVITGSPLVEEFKNSEVLSDIDRPVNDFLRGVIHAMAEEVFESEAVSEEKKCEFLGDERCEIHVRGEG